MSTPGQIPYLDALERQSAKELDPAYADAVRSVASLPAAGASVPENEPIPVLPTTAPPAASEAPVAPAAPAAPEIPKEPSKVGNSPQPAEGAQPAPDAPTVIGGPSNMPAALTAVDTELRGLYASDEPWILINNDPSTNKPIFDAARTRQKIFMAEVTRNLGLFPDGTRDEVLAKAHDDTEKIMGRALGAATDFPITETKPVDMTWFDVFFPSSGTVIERARNLVPDGMLPVALEPAAVGAEAVAHATLFPVDELRTVAMGFGLPAQTQLIQGEAVPEHEIVGSKWETLDWALRPLSPITNTAAALIKFGNTDSPDARHFIRTGGNLSDAVPEIAAVFAPAIEGAYASFDAVRAVTPDAIDPAITALEDVTLNASPLAPDNPLRRSLWGLFSTGSPAQTSDADKAMAQARTAAWGAAMFSMLAEPGPDLALLGTGARVAQAFDWWRGVTPDNMEKMAKAMEDGAQAAIAAGGSTNPVSAFRGAVRRVLGDNKALDTFMDTYLGGVLSAGKQVEASVDTYLAGAANAAKSAIGDTAALRARQTAGAMFRSVKPIADRLTAEMKVMFAAGAKVKLAGADLATAATRVAKLGVRNIADATTQRVVWAGTHRAATAELARANAEISRHIATLQGIANTAVPFPPGSRAYARAMAHLQTQVNTASSALAAAQKDAARWRKNVVGAANAVSRIDAYSAAHLAEQTAQRALSAAQAQLHASLQANQHALGVLGINPARLPADPDKKLADLAAKILKNDAATQRLAAKVAQHTNTMQRARDAGDAVAQAGRDMASAFRDAAGRMRGGLPAVSAGSTKDEVLFRAYHNILINPDRKSASWDGVRTFFRNVYDLFDLDAPAKQYGGSLAPEVGQAAFGAINFISSAQEEMYRLIKGLPDVDAVATVFRYIDSTAAMQGARAGIGFSWVNQAQRTIFQRGRDQMLSQRAFSAAHGGIGGEAFTALSRSLIGSNMDASIGGLLEGMAETALRQSVSLEDFLDRMRRSILAFNARPAKPGSPHAIITLSGNDLRNTVGAALSIVQAAGIHEGGIKLSRSVVGTLDLPGALAARAVLVGKYGDVAGHFGKASGGNIDSALRFLDVLAMPANRRGLQYGPMKVDIDFTSVGNGLSQGAMIFPTNAIKQIEDHVKLRIKRFDDLIPRDQAHDPAMSMLRRLYSIYQRNLVAGTVPFIRLAAWTNNFFGDLSQIWSKHGAGIAGRVAINTVHASARDVLLSVPHVFLSGFSASAGRAFASVVGRGQQITRNPVTLTGSLLNPHIGDIVRGQAGTIVSATGKYRFSYDQIRDFLITEGIYNPQLTDDLYGATSFSARKWDDGPMSGAFGFLNNATEAALDASEMFQNRMRVAHFLDQLLFQEKTIREAAAATREALFDWKHGYNVGSLDSWLSFTVPFYRFYRHGFIQTMLSAMEPFIKNAPESAAALPHTAPQGIRNIHAIADKVPQWFMQELMRGGVGLTPEDNYLSPAQQRIRAEVVPDYVTGRGHFSTQAPDFYSDVYKKYDYKNPTHVLWMMPPLTPIQFGTTFASLGAVAYGHVLSGVSPDHVVNSSAKSIMYDAVKPLLSQSLQITADAITRKQDLTNETALVPLNPGEIHTLRYLGGSIGWLAASTPHGTWLREHLTELAASVEPTEYKRGQQKRPMAHPFVKIALSSMPILSGYTRTRHAYELTGTPEGDAVAAMMLTGVANPYPHDPEDDLMYRMMDIKAEMEAQTESVKNRSLQAEDRLYRR